VLRCSTITVVLNIPGPTVAVVVDPVSDFVGLVPEQDKAAPAFNALVDTPHITGIATLAQGDQARMLILLDIAALLASAKLGLEGLSVHWEPANNPFASLKQASPSCLKPGP
jgi:purine-binding chemotaxis protein CheW